MEAAEGKAGPGLSEEGQEGLGAAGGPLVPAAQHAQQFTGLEALLLCHGLHVKAHVHEELGHVHLLPCEPVSDGGAGRVAVGPGAAVHQVDRAALQRGFAGLVAVVEASVPAVKRPGQRGPLHLDVCPVAADRNPGGATQDVAKAGDNIAATAGAEESESLPHSWLAEQLRKPWKEALPTGEAGVCGVCGGKWGCYVLEQEAKTRAVPRHGDTDLRMMISWDRQAGAKLALWGGGR